MINLFSSANSFRSILTVDKKSKADGGSDSIFTIAEELGLDKIFLIEDNPSSFPQALKNGGDKLVYGLNLTVCNDSDDKTPESSETEHKIYFLAKSGKGYKESLMRLYSDAATRGNYDGVARTDFKRIKEFWSDELVMMIPFYGSFLHKNLTTFSHCMVEFAGYDPVFCVESHNLPLDKLMGKKVKEYCGDAYEVIETNRAYYKDESNALAYMVYMCIQNKSDMEKPNLDGFCSGEFYVKWK